MNHIRAGMGILFMGLDPKTRMSARANRQMVTGLTVNSKVNVTDEFYKNTRAMCHYLFSGKEAYRDTFYLDDNEDEPVASLAYVEGRLSFQYFIRNRFDQRSLKEKQDSRTAFDKLYRDFMLLRYSIGRPSHLSSRKATPIEYI